MFQGKLQLVLNACSVALSRVLKFALLCNVAVPVRFQGISLSDFLDRETPASNSPSLLELPTPVDGRTCPPAIEFMGESTLEILVIPIENGGCYEFKTPFYNQGGYPRATYHSYQCTYEIQVSYSSKHFTRLFKTVKIMT